MPDIITVCAVVLLDYYVFVILMVLAIMATVGWSVEREKRILLKKGARELEEIFSLTSQVLKSGSRANIDQINSMIENWDKTYCEVVGEPIPKLT